MATLAPPRLCLSHYGPIEDPLAAIDLARRQLGLMREAAEAACVQGELAAQIALRLPLAASLDDPAALGLWLRLGWADVNVRGLAERVVHRDG